MYPTTWRGTPLTRTVSPLPPVSVSAKPAAGSRLSRFWSRPTIDSPVPSRTVPASGGMAPVSSESSVVLPAPFGPTMPTRSPRITRVEKSRTTARPPSDLAMPRASITSVPEPDASAAAMRGPPWGRSASRRRCRNVGQLAHAPHVALAPRGDAVAEPVLLAQDLAPELVALALLLFQHRVAPRLEGREALVEAPGGAAVQPDHRAGQRLEEAPVVADQHQRRAGRGQFGLQPGDRREVQVVRRLVEQQDVGRGGQDLRQRDPPGLPAGQAPRVLLAGEAELLEQVPCPVRVVARSQPRLDVGQGRRRLAEIRLLREVAQRGAGLEEPGPVFRRQRARGDAQQGGLAGAVAAHQGEALAGRHREGGAPQQGGRADREADVLQEEERRRHGLSRPNRSARRWPAGVAPLPTGGRRRPGQETKASEPPRARITGRRIAWPTKLGKGGDHVRSRRPFQARRAASRRPLTVWSAFERDGGRWRGAGTHKARGQVPFAFRTVSLQPAPASARARWRSNRGEGRPRQQ